MSVAFISSTRQEAGQALVGPHLLDSLTRAWRTLSMPSWFTTEELPSAGSWPGGGGGAAALITLFLARRGMAARARDKGSKEKKKAMGRKEDRSDGRGATYRLHNGQITQLPRLHGESSHHVPSNCYTLAWPAGFGARGASSSARHHPEENSTRALGPGAIVGVLGTRVPRLACLRPTSRSWYGPVGPS